MFDKAIIDMDKFMDLPMSSKALYFLLGMEADDEGFVSYKKVMRIHGGSEDDMKILIAKEFILHFPSGVVVITDWNQNNYLDKNRLKETQYRKEKEMLVLTEDNKYVLNNGLTSIEESSIVQNSIEESKPPTPKEFFNQIEEQENLVFALKEKYGDSDIYATEIKKFVDYWTEPNATGKQRWQLQPTFEVRRRLTTWLSKIKQFNGMPTGRTRKVIKL